MSTRMATGTRFKEGDERRAMRAKENAQLWKLVKAAMLVIDSSRRVGIGVYEIPPEAMLAMKHRCDDLRFPLKMQELEAAKEGKNDE